MEKIYLYNTLTKKKEEFKPLKKGVVGFYQCGPTVYWTQHLGNLRAAVLGDIIRRVFEYDGYKVKYVKNYTDVGHMTSDEDEGEDKMTTTGLGVKCKKCQKIFNSGIAVTKKAFATGTFSNNVHVCPFCGYENLVKDKNGYVIDEDFRKSPLDVAKKYIQEYEQAAVDLNIKEPWKKPRATKHIKEMQAMVKILLKKGFAYATPLAIYFDVSKFPNYTELSRQNLEKNIIGEGSGDVTDPAKKHPRDFALWFFRAGVHANALQFWKSPFKSPLVKSGEGFPGWHIECSAMSKKYLGPTLDVHMGGIEHIPVHHTNEIAQSEAANGVKYVNYWLHNEHLLVNEEKMAKSQGTGFTLAEVKEKGFSPLALRYYFLSANYRSPQNFTWEALQAAQNGLEHLYSQISVLKNSPLSRGVDAPRGRLAPRSSAEQNEVGGVLSAEYRKKFVTAVNDDFNTPAALSVLQEVLKSNLLSGDKLATILDFDRVLGLNFGRVLSERLCRGQDQETVPAEVGVLVEARAKARAEKNWPESDRLRAEIEAKGFSIEDTKEGMKINKK
ncbi:MAG: cysteine--tRNA ligase [Patescibacteria group bacterium]|nr:cysteine--tRNA ligase [Patescibacteria group bacterium]